MTIEDEEGHEVEACYSMCPVAQRHVPCLLCSCGFSARESTWEEVGVEFDRHLEDEGLR